MMRATWWIQDADGDRVMERKEMNSVRKMCIT